MAVKENVTLERTVLIRLLQWAGWKSAQKWDDERLAKKTLMLKEVLPDEHDPPEDEALLEAYENVFAAIENKVPVEIIDDSGSEDEETDEDEKDGEDEKDEKKPAKKKSSSSINPKKSRGYCAAQVLRDNGGLEAGVTDEMIQKVDEMYGKPNPSESRAWLVIAWHALNGYLEEYPVE